MPETYRQLIGGELVDGGDGAYAIVNPATTEVVGHAPEASTAQVEAAAQAAAAAFPAWSRTTFAERAELLSKAADHIQSKAPELIPLVQAETGATLRVTKTMQVPTVWERLRKYAAYDIAAENFPLPPQAITSTALAPGGVMNSIVERRPVGVVACITPYNFPIVNMAGKVGPALAMGNTVVVKPAPQDPLAVLRFGELLHEAGIPPGVVNVVAGSGAPAGEALVAAPEVDMISFTGSTGVGQRIGAVAGHDMKRLLLELGGKGAAVVLDDADLKTTIPAIVATWAFHSGQICTAPTRVLAHRSVLDHVVGGLAQAAANLKVGDPLEADTVLGPVISEAHRDRVESYVEAGRQAGTIVAGGQRPDLPGYYVAPTLVTDVKPTDRVVVEEIFGPVVVVLPFDDDDEAVALANGTDFGLYDYVFSRDTARAMHIGRQLRSGNVGLNTLQRHHEAAFGGMKLSGVGRDGGRFGLHAYSELQSLVW